MAKSARSVLDGISFENRKLEEVIKEQEEKHRATAIEHQRRQDQSRGQRLTGIPWGRTVKTTYRGRSSKAKRWDAHKIRREYGLMKKKFDSQWENCLWMVGFDGPVTARQILETIGGSQGGVTGAISYIYQFLGENNDYGTVMINRQDHGPGKPKTYMPNEELVTEEARTVWFEKARDLYIHARRIYNRARAQERNEAKKREIDNVFANDLIETQKPETQAPKTEKLAPSAIEELTEKPYTKIKEETLEKPMHEEREAKEYAVAEERMNRTEQAEALEQVIGDFVVAKLKSLDLVKTAELKLTMTGGIKIDINFGFGKI